MAQDICERLRSGHLYSGIVDPLDIEAAVEIERLRSEIERLGNERNDYFRRLGEAGLISLAEMND